MKLTTTLFPAMLVLSLGLGAHRARAASPPTNSTSQAIEIIRKKHDLPALAVVVTKDGAICDRAAVGVRRWGEATRVTTNDLFHLGSCTKSMTATLAARLIEEGKLRWETTIGEVFPGLKGRMDPRYEGVTVVQLLHHRGGVPGEPPAAAWAAAWRETGTPVEQRREFIAAVLREPPAAPPGSKCIYSNQGYAIVGAMIEKLTGTPYEDLMVEKLFRPLGMNTAGFGPPGTAGKTDQPEGHVRRMFMTMAVRSDNPPAIAPAGRVHCSLDDLARYTMFHLGRTGSTLLKPETLARLHDPAETAGDDRASADYACGWVVLKRGWAGGTALMHNGSNTMWYVVMWLAPERNFSVIAAANIFAGGADQACDEAASAMILKWLPK